MGTDEMDGREAGTGAAAGTEALAGAGCAGADVTRTEAAGAGEGGAQDGELLAALRDRSATYELLARLMVREVDVELLAGLRAMGWAAMADAAGTPTDGADAAAGISAAGANAAAGCGAGAGMEAGADGAQAVFAAPVCEAELLGSGARLIGDYLAQHPASDDEATCTELAVDFARLFVVRSRSEKHAAYPFESVYTSEGHHTMDRARDEVRALYRAAGLARDERWNVGEDHVALELEFMAELSRRAEAACACGDDAALDDVLRRQASFLDAHLLSWVGLLAQAMEAVAHTPFYRGLARFLVGWLRDDRTFLRAALGA